MLSVKIFDELKKLGITNQEVCDKLGWNTNKATDIKRGKSSLSIDDLVKLAEIFHFSLDSILSLQTNQSVYSNGDNNINLANNGDNNSFFAPQQKSQLSEFESQLLELYNSLATPKKMELLNFAFNLKNNEN